MTCTHMEGVIARRRAGLSEAEKLELDHHLEGCAPCSEKARHLDAMAALSDRMVSTLPSSKREQLITRALAFQDVSSPPATRWWLWGSAVTVAGLVALGALFVFSDRPGQPPPLSVADEGPQPARGHTNHIIVAFRPTTVPLAHAQVRFAGQSRARWDAEQRTVSLEAGGLRATVDAAPNRFFRVQTGAFTVEALGGVLHVGPRSVRAIQGQVRVLDLQGRLLALLDPGASWPSTDPKVNAKTPSRATQTASKATQTASKATQTPPKAPQTAPKATAKTRSARPAAATVASVNARAKRKRPIKPAPRVKYGATLRAARRVLSEGRVDQARRLIRRVRTAKRTPRRYRAEATMLLAECSVVHGMPRRRSVSTWKWPTGSKTSRRPKRRCSRPPGRVPKADQPCFCTVI